MKHRAICIALAVVSLVTISFVFVKSPQRRSITARSNPSCEIEGNPDLYGIGIRLGFYMQVLGSAIVLFFKRQEGKSLVATNLWFQLGLQLALIYSSTKDSIHVSEAFIAMNLLLLLIWWNETVLAVLQSTRTGSEAITGNTSEECGDVSKQPTIMIIATILLWVAAEYYATWFWWRGLGSLERGPCGDHAFFFARVNLHGWFRWLYRAINAFMVGGSSLVLLSCVLISLIIWLEMCKYGSFGSKWEQRYPILTRRKALYQQYLAGERKWWHLVAELTRKEKVGDIEVGEHVKQPIELSNISALPADPSSPPEHDVSQGTHHRESLEKPNAGDPVTNPAGQIIARSMSITSSSPKDQVTPPFIHRNANPSTPDPSSTHQGKIPQTLDTVTISSPPTPPNEPPDTTRHRNDNDGDLTTTTISSCSSSSTFSEEIQTKAFSLFSLSMFLVLYTFGVVTIECTIAFNHFTNVNNLISTGQLIPFVIGLGSLCQGLWLFRKAEKRPELANVIHVFNVTVS